MSGLSPFVSPDSVFKNTEENEKHKNAEIDFSKKPVVLLKRLSERKIFKYTQRKKYIKKKASALLKDGNKELTNIKSKAATTGGQTTNLTKSNSKKIKNPNDWTNKQLSKHKESSLKTIKLDINQKLLKLSARPTQDKLMKTVDKTASSTSRSGQQLFEENIRKHSNLGRIPKKSESDRLLEKRNMTVDNLLGGKENSVSDWIEARLKETNKNKQNDTNKTTAPVSTTNTKSGRLKLIKKPPLQVSTDNFSFALGSLLDNLREMSKNGVKLDEPPPGYKIKKENSSTRPKKRFQERDDRHASRKSFQDNNPRKRHHDKDEMDSRKRARPSTNSNFHSRTDENTHSHTSRQHLEKLPDTSSRYTQNHHEHRDRKEQLHLHNELRNKDSRYRNVSKRSRHDEQRPINHLLKNSEKHSPPQPRSPHDILQPLSKQHRKDSRHRRSSPKENLQHHEYPLYEQDSRRSLSPNRELKRDTRCKNGLRTDVSRRSRHDEQRSMNHLLKESTKHSPLQPRSSHDISQPLSKQHNKDSRHRRSSPKENLQHQESLLYVKVSRRSLSPNREPKRSSPTIHTVPHQCTVHEDFVSQGRSYEHSHPTPQPSRSTSREKEQLRSKSRQHLPDLHRKIKTLNERFSSQQIKPVKSTSPKDSFRNSPRMHESYQSRSSSKDSSKQSPSEQTMIQKPRSREDDINRQRDSHERETLNERFSSQQIKPLKSTSPKDSFRNSPRIHESYQSRSSSKDSSKQSPSEQTMIQKPRSRENDINRQRDSHERRMSYLSKSSPTMNHHTSHGRHDSPDRHHSRYHQHNELACSSSHRAREQKERRRHPSNERRTIRTHSPSAMHEKINRRNGDRHSLIYKQSEQSRNHYMARPPRQESSTGPLHTDREYSRRPHDYAKLGGERSNGGRTSKDNSPKESKNDVMDPETWIKKHIGLSNN